MEARLFWFMDIGPRETQEDCIMFNDTIKQTDQGQGYQKIMPDAFVAAVCDGLGGHDAGEVASRFFCDSLLKVDPVLPSSGLGEEMRRMQVASIDMIPSACGTTMAGIRKSENHVLVFNAGDSRVYHITETLTQISHDHSYVQELVDNHFISDDDAPGHPYKNVVTFGMGPVFQHNEANREVFLKEIMVNNGDGILICSDGVSDSLGNSAIAAALLNTESGGENLVEKLYEKGMRDNSSFIYIWFP